MGILCSYLIWRNLELLAERLMRLYLRTPSRDLKREGWSGLGLRAGFDPRTTELNLASCLSA